MLIRFSASNHASLRESQELSFVASTSLKEKEIDAVPIGHDLELLRVAALYGANASGKTNVLGALRFMHQVVMNSHRAWGPEKPIPRKPFLLNPAAKKQPSTFEIDFLLDDVRYQYGFSISADFVLDERLFAFPTGRRQMLFTRTGQEFRFGKHLVGENRVIEALTRPNSLFLSAAAQNNHNLLLPIYKWFANQLRFALVSNEDERLTRIARTIQLIYDGEKDAVLRFLKAADLGVVDLVLNEKQPHMMDVSRFVEVSQYHLTGSSLPPNLFETSLVHQSSKLKVGVQFPFEAESDGTINLFALAGDFIESLKSGSVLCIDELDASLHPSVAMELVRIVNDPKSNPKNAQLLFSTHNTLLLDRKVLRRDQVWFTEKDGDGATHLYPLTDFKPRQQENIEVGYLQGRYGAIPMLNSQAFLSALGVEDG